MKLQKIKQFKTAKKLIEKGTPREEAFRQAGISHYTYHTYKKRLQPRPQAIEIPQTSSSSGMVFAFFGSPEQVAAAVRGLQ